MNKQKKRKKRDRSVALISTVILMLALLIVFICLDRGYDDLEKKWIQCIKGLIKKSNILGLSYSNAKEVLPQTAYSFLFAIYAILGSSLVFMWNRSEAKIFGIEVKDSVSFAWNFLCKIILIWMAILPLLTLWFQNCGYVLSAYWMITTSFFLALFQFYLTSNTFKGEKRLDLVENGLYLQLKKLDADVLYQGKNEGGNLRNYIYTLCFNIYRQQGHKDIVRIYMDTLERIPGRKNEREEQLYKFFVFSYEYAYQVLAVCQGKKKGRKINLAALLLQDFQDELESQSFTGIKEINKKKYVRAYIGLLFGLYSAEYFEAVNSHAGWMTDQIYATGDDGTGRKEFLEELAFYLVVMLEVALKDDRNDNSRFLQFFDGSNGRGNRLWFNMKAADSVILDRQTLEKMESYGNIKYLSCCEQIRMDKMGTGREPASHYKILLERGIY